MMGFLIRSRADAYEHDNVMPAAAPRTEDTQRYLTSQRLPISTSK
jgi:hypothetical protein